jgi:hypothetical protein
LLLGGNALNHYPALADFIGADIHITDAIRVTQTNF